MAKKNGEEHGMLKQSKEKSPLAIELSDEALNTAVGGEDNPRFWGGDCDNCGWGCRCSTYGDAKQHIDEHVKNTGHHVVWITNAR